MGEYRSDCGFRSDPRQGLVGERFLTGSLTAADTLLTISEERFE